MSILPEAVLKRIRKSYKKSYVLEASEILPSGERPDAKEEGANLPALTGARSYALSEAVRWGEPCIFFLMPNVISWIVPVVRDQAVLGGLCGGEILTDDDPADRLETVNHLAAAGCARSLAESYCAALPVWSDREQPRKAAEFLYALTCCEISWDMLLLSENRKKALRQRQIAEEIHRRKQGRGDRTLMNEERTLLSLMRAGDQKGARRELNKTLGALFSHTADIRLLKAHVIELMGYLTRSAIEESPHLSSLIERNHEWMARIIDTNGFEELTDVVSDALDDFMNRIHMQSQSRSNTTVSRILDYLGEHFHETVTLDMLARETGLSRFRIAHLVKEVTGKTVLQHIHRLRLQEAQRLLEQSDLTCTDIAYECGFGDQSYFIKQFRRQLGITPARYRSLYRTRRNG